MWRIKELLYGTVFRLWCKYCKQTFRTPSHKIRLYTNTPSPFYTFKCKNSRCKAINKKPANKKAMEILLVNGAEHHITPPPKYLTKTNTPPLTMDDLIDLHFALEKGGIVEQVRKLGRRKGSRGEKNG